MLRTLMIACAFAALAPAAMAETLDEATQSALDGNPNLASARARLNATREQLPQAWAEAFPSISASAGADASSGDGGDDESWSAGLNASQLLFGGGRVLASTRQARANIAGAVADFTDTTQQLVLDVAAAYAGVRQTQAVVAARETTVANLTRQFEYATAQFDAGLVTRTDVAQSQARLAQARTQLTQAQGQLSSAIEAYIRLVGHPPSDLQPPPTAPGLPANLQEALDRAAESSPVLIGAQAAALAADAGVDLTRSSFLPNVSLSAGTNISGDFDDGDDFQSESVGVRMSWQLFNGGLNLSRSRQARQLRNAATFDVASAERAVREEVTTSWTGLESARAAVVSAREQVEAAELAYQGIRLEQETGLRSTIDVLIQEQDLLDARLALAAAERDLVVAERQMLASMGALVAPPQDD
ncbi:MAG: TolC family outer membrane protein [Hyphomonadaceae bacterium]